jgi:hypothetical protein
MVFYIETGGKYTYICNTFLFLWYIIIYKLFGIIRNNFQLFWYIIYYIYI